MPDQKPTLGYASSDVTRLSDREGAGRYYRELPSVGTIAVFVVIVLTICALFLMRRVLH